ncbi:hypothetical protein [Caballeronia grimmiae]|uniref:hypothetical protein n=1 Tax=Caballeronia grimmiae TaxID=1071679 RepID=UPI0038BC0B0B
MPRKPLVRICLYASALLLLALVVGFNAVNLIEAYGSGAPYYSRTVNMDKWVDPLPLLALVDALTVLLLFATVRMLRRKP